MAYETEMQIPLKKQPFSVDDSEYLIRQHQCQKILEKAISLLPPQQRQVYTLSKIEGLSHESIAAEMQLSKLTVKTHMARALQFIRKYLNAHLHNLLVLSILFAAK